MHGQAEGPPNRHGEFRREVGVRDAAHAVGPEEAPGRARGPAQRFEN